MEKKASLEDIVSEMVRADMDYLQGKRGISASKMPLNT